MPNKYTKIIGGVEVDVYVLCRVFNVTDPELQHALKKILFKGSRGAKGAKQDITEAADSLMKWLNNDGVDFAAAQNRETPLFSFPSEYVLDDGMLSIEDEALLHRASDLTAEAEALKDGDV